jgi:hypothetical protein
VLNVFLILQPEKSGLSRGSGLSREGPLKKGTSVLEIPLLFQVSMTCGNHGERNVTMETVQLRWGHYHGKGTMGEMGSTMDTIQWGVTMETVPWIQYNGVEGCYHGDSTMELRGVTMGGCKYPILVLLNE